jgi:hypothetical protein
MKILKSLMPYESIPMVVIALVIIILIAFQAYRAIAGRKLKGLVNDTILFFGFLSLSWAILCQIYGLFVAAGAVSRAGEISPELIWAGIGISMSMIIMGLVTLMFSAIGWFVFRAIARRGQ